MTTTLNLKKNGVAAPTGRCGGGWKTNKQTNKSPLFIDTNSVKDGLAEPQGSTSSPSHCRPFALRDSQAISEPQFTV